MTIVNIHEAKTQLSRLLEHVAEGETVTIARAGKPVAKLVRYDADDREQRLGFLVGHGTVPDDFDELEADRIADLFGADGAASA
ncbi:type II toxin-antitoxin system Phd/YefM family antitoxin [Brevibacterium atlanticum]|uniref:type II toxin-antitoxin system Phd/YefM family antitoxin n=1 Tax=Brevibacterium atlanticum TaxID=2697563 RepID=UPI00141D79ED|nr:type II toxin-antitoxin system prevent-host-death family antitoxin [Brevibacterium atlanticum]